MSFASFNAEDLCVLSLLWNASSGTQLVPLTMTGTLFTLKTKWWACSIGLSILSGQLLAGSGFQRFSANSVRAIETLRIPMCYDLEASTCSFFRN